MAGPALDPPGSSVPTGVAATPVPGVRTRLQQGIRQPKQFTDGTVTYKVSRGTVRYGLLISTGEPRNITDVLSHPQWRQAIQEEYDALLQNNTWHLVPRNSTMTWITRSLGDPKRKV